MMVTPPSLLVPRGPYQGSGVIGEITESLHAFLREGWPDPSDPPRIVEDLEFEPKDREKILYIYMYRVAHNQALQNSKRWREAKVAVQDDAGSRHFYERPPLYLDVYYLIAVHAKFRSEAEKLLGWLLLRLNEATHIVYRPRRYVLPDLTEVDSTGSPWSIDNRGDDVIMEKVSLDLVDDLSVGDAIHFFNIHDAPYRPFLTYRARCAMEGSLIEAKPTMVGSLPLTNTAAPPEPRPRPQRPKIGPGPTPGQARARLGSPSAGRGSTPEDRTPMPFGPPGYARRPLDPTPGDPQTEGRDNQDSED
jgi:hypothetical protein